MGIFPVFSYVKHLYHYLFQPWSTMSSKQPNTRKRPQKHQNTTAWNAADKWKTDPKTKLVQKIVVTNCCPKCTSVIEWKIK